MLGGAGERCSYITFRMKRRNGGWGMLFWLAEWPEEAECVWDQVNGPKVAELTEKGFIATVDSQGGEHDIELSTLRTRKNIRFLPMKVSVVIRPILDANLSPFYL